MPKISRCKFIKRLAAACLGESLQLAADRNEAKIADVDGGSKLRRGAAGFQTPSRAFGEQFVLELPGIDLQMGD